MKLKPGDRVRITDSPDEARLNGATGTMRNVKHWGLCMELDEPRDGFRSRYAYIMDSDKVEVL